MGAEYSGRELIADLSSFAVDELLPSFLLRLLQALSFFFHVRDTLCGKRHGVRRHIVAVNGALQLEYEFTIYDLVGAKFPGQNRYIIFVSAIIVGARRQHLRSESRDFRLPLVEIVQEPADDT